MKALLLLALVCGMRSAYAGETWLTVPLASWHENREREGGKGSYEQTNMGLGLEYAYSERVRFAAGLYRSSIRTDAGYVGVAYLPFTYRELRFGSSVGVVSGYEGNLIPVVVPTVVWEGRSVGLNLMVIPQTKQTKTAGLGLSLKFRLP